MGKRETNEFRATFHQGRVRVRFKNPNLFSDVIYNLLVVLYMSINYRIHNNTNREGTMLCLILCILIATLLILSTIYYYIYLRYAGYSIIFMLKYCNAVILCNSSQHLTALYSILPYYTRDTTYQNTRIHVVRATCCRSTPLQYVITYLPLIGTKPKDPKPLLFFPVVLVAVALFDLVLWCLCPILSFLALPFLPCLFLPCLLSSLALSCLSLPCSIVSCFAFSCLALKPLR
jgi:hypothetical protein